MNSTLGSTLRRNVGASFRIRIACEPRGTRGLPTHPCLKLLEALHLRLVERTLEGIYCAGGGLYRMQWRLSVPAAFKTT